jgi:hypothetical protein
MHALSVKQPYASLIATGAKTIEWRSKVWNYRGPVVICASKNPKPAVPEGSKHYLPVGKAICIVDMVDCRFFTEDDLGPAVMRNSGIKVIKGKDGYAWVLENPREINPIDVKGIVAPWPWKGREPILCPEWHKNHNFDNLAEKLQLY